MRSGRRRKAVVLCMAVMMVLMIEEDDLVPYYGSKIDQLSFNPSYGIGRGKGLRKRTIKRTPIDVYSTFLHQNGAGNTFRRMVRLELCEFQELLEELKNHVIVETVPSVSLENQTILVFIWIHHYPDGASLSLQFGICPTSVSKIIGSILIQLAEFFKTKIPNKFNSTGSTSSLSNLIVGVLDGTIHRTYKPLAGQSALYNSHYGVHGVLSQIMCDFEGFIIAFASNINGSTHDSLFCSVDNLFQNVLGNKYCLTDPGFQGVSSAVAGFKPCHLPNTKGHQKFDSISRKEQIIIEHVNCWLKKSKTVDKDTKFRHGHNKLVMCVFICCGLYNYKKIKGFAF